MARREGPRDPADPQLAGKGDAAHAAYVRTRHHAVAQRTSKPSPASGTRDPDKVIDLANKLAPDGDLGLEASPGTWRVLRFGCTIGDHA